MNLSEEVDLEDYVARPDRINNAEIASICQVRAHVLVWWGLHPFPGGGVVLVGACVRLRAGGAIQ